jgi:predicted RNase H-like HicB family nuclease
MSIPTFDAKPERKSFIVLIEKDEDGFFIGTVPSVKGCYTDGYTLDELMANLEEAIEAHIEAFGSEEKELPVTRFAGVQESIIFN